MIAFSLLFGLFINICSGCVAPGQTCWSTTGGVVSGGCCGGTQCAPWLPTGGNWDGSSAWYCLFLPKLPLGTACNYDNKIGLCESGTCCNGICAASCASSSSSVAPTTVSGTSMGSSAASTSSAAPTTTTDGCTLAAKAVCAYSTYPDLNFGCCSSPYTCTPVASNADVSVCAGSNLAAGKTCWSSPDTAAQPDNTGTCDSTAGLICVNEVCSEDDPTCNEVGVNGNNLCVIGSLNLDVNGRTCCTATDGTPNACMKGNDTTNSYCMSYNIPDGSPCGVNEADNYAGYCNTATSVCDTTTTPSLCRTTAATTTSTVTTSTTAEVTTTTGPTTTAEACIVAGQPCYVNNVVQSNCCAGSSCAGPTPFTSGNCE